LIVTFGLALCGTDALSPAFQVCRLARLDPGVCHCHLHHGCDGLCCAVWFERGERISNEALKQMTKEMTKYLLETMKGFGKRKPGRKNLQETISQALENSPMAQDPSSLKSRRKSTRLSRRTSCRAW
jgi:hypothetical protein